MSRARSIFARMADDSGTFLQCECQQEVITLQKYDSEEVIELSIWQSGFSYPLSFIKRLRFCFSILFKGRPYGDQVVLSKKNARRVAEVLYEFSFEEPKYTEHAEK